MQALNIFQISKFIIVAIPHTAQLEVKLLKLDRKPPLHVLQDQSLLPTLRTSGRMVWRSLEGSALSIAQTNLLFSPVLSHPLERNSKSFFYWVSQKCTPFERILLSKYQNIKGSVSSSKP